MPSRHTEFSRRAVCCLFPAALLALTPKCLLCVLAYAGLGAMLGLGGPEICGASGGHSSLTWGPTTPPDYRLQASNDNPGGQLQELDLNVKATLIRHGNYDYLTRTTIWEPSNSTQTIPASLYYDSRPAWWPPDVAFPSIGPDLTPMNGMNPAYKRFKDMGTGWPSP